MNYEEAAQLMALHEKRARKDPTTRKLKYETTLRKCTFAPEVYQPPTYTLRYFNTDILTYHHDQVELHDGGFFSRSTHNRFNEYLPRGFQIWGTTYPKLGLRRPLGFIETPKGCFPYRSVMFYRYDGAPVGTPYAPNSREVVEALPAYIDRYLDVLFTKGEFHHELASIAEGYLKQGRKLSFNSVERESCSHNVAETVTSSRLFKHLVTVIGTRADKDPLEALGVNMALSDLGRLLAYEGFSAFKRSTTNDERAAKLELAFVYEGKLPTINKQKLRAYLRRELTIFFVQQLGFAEVEWHRR